jgi:hypothetical protein
VGWAVGWWSTGWRWDIERRGWDCHNSVRSEHRLVLSSPFPTWQLKLPKPPGCPIPVKAPQFALVFLNPQQDAGFATSTMTQTFSTTAGRKLNTATVAQAVLETSNGMGGKDNSISILGSTSRKRVSSGWSLNGGLGRAWWIAIAVAVGGSWALRLLLV